MGNKTFKGEILPYRLLGDIDKHLQKRKLQKVGLEDKIHHKPTELSGGQQRRVSIARALSSKPSIILADEPTGALDSKSGIEIMQMLHELHTEGNTIVLITHDLNIAKQAERIVTTSIIAVVITVNITVFIKYPPNGT